MNIYAMDIRMFVLYSWPVKLVTVLSAIASGFQQELLVGHLRKVDNVSVSRNLYSKAYFLFLFPNQSIDHIDDKLRFSFTYWIVSTNVD